MVQVFGKSSNKQKIAFTNKFNVVKPEEYFVPFTSEYFE
jgi:hypothetical protein